jgi:hypothetical protein
MDFRTKFGFGCYLLMLILCGVFGLLYLFSPQFMPYHAVAIGATWNDLPSAYRILILALMKAVGAGSLGSFIAGLFILLIPFRSGFPWANWALLIIGLVVSIPGLYAMLTVRWSTPASPPWVVPLIGMLLAIAGFTLSTKRAHARVGGVK